MKKGADDVTNRQIAAQQTRKRLMETAKQIICEKGLANTSIAEITNACGVSNGTFYTYFKRKEDIVFALSWEVFQEILDNAQAYQGTFMQRLVFFMLQFSGYIEKSSLKLCQEWVRNTVDPDLVENPDDKNKLHADIHSVKQIIESGIKRGELKPDTPADVLAHTLIDVLYGEMLCWDMSGGTYCFEARTKEFCDLFLGAIINPYLIRKDDISNADPNNQVK